MNITYFQLEMDGRKMELPELEGIVFLNINSWCGGCELWVNGDEEHSSPPRSVYCNCSIKLNTISFNMKFKIKVLRDLQNKKKFKTKVLLVGVTAVTFKRRGHQKELKH